MMKQMLRPLDEAINIQTVMLGYFRGVLRYLISNKVYNAWSEFSKPRYCNGSGAMHWTLAS